MDLVEKIHTAFDGARRLALAGYSSAVGNDVVLGRFFDNVGDPDDSDDDGEQEDVVSVHKLLFDSSGDGNFAPLLASFVFNNVDWLALCPETSGGSQKRKRSDSDDDDGDDDDGDDDNGGVTLGYSGNIEDDDGNNVWNIHFCNAWSALTALDDIQYSALDPYPSLKMDSMARVLLHEIFHSDKVGPQSS